MAAAQAAENHGDEWCLTCRNIYISSNLNPLTKFTRSSRNIKFKDILPWNISQMITKTVPISTRIDTSHAMKQDIPFQIWQKACRNWDNNTIKTSQWRESYCRTNTTMRRKKEIQKSGTMRITVWDLSRKVNHLKNIIWDRNIITEFTKSISSTRIGSPVLIKNNFMAPFYGWGSTASRLEPLQGGSLFFTTSSQKFLLLILSTKTLFFALN